MAGTLYLVATPIGNPEDLSFRARRLLGEAAFIAAEDPQASRRLLDYYDIHTPVTSYHNLNKEQKARIIVSRLLDGETACLICDAGTPALYDPGLFLIQEARHAGCRVVPIPGPSAVTAALSVAGLPANEFVFLGPVPASRVRRKAFFSTIAGERRTTVLFVQPGLLQRVLQELSSRLGEREVVIAADLSMETERLVRGRVCSVADAARGLTATEVTLVIEGGNRRDSGRQSVRRRRTTRHPSGS